MSQPVDQIIATLAEVQLPALDYSKTALKRALARRSTAHADLAAIIALDPGLTVLLFQELARAPRKPAEPILEPSRIIGLLGVASVHKLVAAAPILEERFRGAALLGLKKGYSRALHAAFYARTLATLRGRPQTDADATVALLQNLGLLGLWAKKPGTLAVLESNAERPEDLDLLGERQLGFSPAHFGQVLASRWSLPDLAARAQYFHNSYDGNVQIPLLASALAWSTLSDWQSEQTLELIQLAADLTHLHPDMVRSRLHRDAAEAARAAYDRELPSAAAGLLLPPGSQPAAPRSTMPKPAPKAPARKAKALSEPVTRPAEPAAKPAAETVAATDAAPAAVQPSPKPAPATKPPAAKPTTAPAAKPVARTAATTLAPKPPAPAPKTAAAPAAKPAAEVPASSAKPNPLQDKLNGLLAQAQQKIGLEHILFAMLTPDRQHIRGRFVMETNKSELGGFKAPARTRNLFALMMSKPAALWVNGDNQIKYLPMIPSEVAGLINIGDFITVSVVVKKKPIGLLYADNGDTPLVSEQFEQFKVLSARVAGLFGSS